VRVVSVAQTKATLLRAAELIETGWTQHAGSCTLEGEAVDWYDERAQRFCLLSAIRRAVGGQDWDAKRHEEFHGLRVIVLKAIGVEGAASWNDDPKRTQAEVVDALRKAAETCK